MDSYDLDPFAVEGRHVPAAQGSAAGTGQEPDPDWQPL
jgi:hypothetical protein